MMIKPLHLLIVEDSPDDAELMVRTLRRYGYTLEWRQVETKSDYLDHLTPDLDIILCDYHLPQFSALRALEILKESGLDVPFIIVSGAIGEDMAVATITQGADDYLLKDRLARLGQAVANVLEQKQLRDEKRRADDRLRASEKRFRALIERSADIVMLLDPTGVIIYSGPSLTAVLGYSVAESIGQPIFELIHPDERDLVVHKLKGLAQQANSVVSLQKRMRHKDGRWCWIEGVATNLLNDPDVEAIVFNYRDISERKEAEEALQRTHDELEQRVETRTAELSVTVDALKKQIKRRKKVQGALAAEKRRLELLYNLSQNLSTTLNPREVASKALEAIMTALNAFRGELFLFDNERLLLSASAGYDAELLILLDGRTELRLGQGLPGYVAQERTATAVSDVGCSDYWLPLPGLDDTICSAAAVPLLAGDELVGVLNLLSDQVNFFDQTDLPLLQAVATPMALSLQNARLYEAEQRARQVADTLRASNLALSARLEFDTVLETLLEHLSRLVSYQTASVIMLGNDRLITQAMHNPKQSVNGASIQHLNQNMNRITYLRDLLTAQKPLVIPDTAQYPGWESLDGAADTRSWLGVPLLAGGKMIGLFTLSEKEPDSFTGEHLQIVEAMAGQAAIAIQNAQLYRMVRMGGEQLRKLTHQVVTSQEEERHRFSYLLHDEAGQSLSALQIELSLIRSDLSNEEHEPLRQKLDEAIKLTTDTIDQIRSLAQALRPPALDVVGLNPTLQNYCRDFAERTGLHLTYSGQDLPPLDSAFSISFYRYLQEALTNVATHAQAQRVQVSLDYDGETVSLLVTDNGRGFDFHADRAASGQPGSIGLLGLQERFTLLGGSLEITSQPGAGTRLLARAPWENKSENE